MKWFLPLFLFCFVYTNLLVPYVSDLWIEFYQIISVVSIFVWMKNHSLRLIFRFWQARVWFCGEIGTSLRKYYMYTL